MVVFTEAQRSNLQALIEGNTVDEQWVTGIRAGWKKLVQQTKQFKDRTHSRERDLDFAREMVKNADAALQNMQRYISRLRSDLLISKGFWTLPSTAGTKEINLARRWKSKVIVELDAADEAISGGISSLKHWLDAYITPPNDDHPWIGMYHKEISSREGFDTILRTIGGAVDEAVDKADAAISKRLLRHLSSLVKMAPVGPSGKHEPLDLGTFEPEVLHIGSFTVVFQDSPESPGRIGTRTTTAAKGTVVKYRGIGKPTEKGEVYRNPKYRKGYARFIKEAFERLSAKRLGFLAKGVTIVVRPEGRAPTNQYAASLGVSANYDRHTSTITIFTDPSPHIAKTVVHELGHHYWFKYMSNQDRENFGRWFGQVPAVSSYGGRHRREDFAEAFAYYVMGQKMTKDQVQRFRQFMTGQRPRLEALEEGTATKAQKCKYCEQPAAVSLIWADGRAYIPVCKAHERKARNRIASQNDSVCDVKQVEQGPITYREHTFVPHARMEQALRPALDFVDEEEPGTYFGLQADGGRAQSAFDEAPSPDRGNLPRARIGRRSAPRGAIHTQHSGPDIQGMKGQPIKRATGKDLGRGTRGPTRKVTLPSRERREIPDSLLQMLGTDWKTMRATRVHDNRMTVNIDGVRYSVYTRRG